MNFKSIRALSALGLATAMLAGCASGPADNSGGASGSGVITGTAMFRERMALPPNAVFEALLEDVSRADARAVVLGQQNIGPAGNPPYAIRIPFDAGKIDPRGRYNVRTSIRVNDQLWFTSDQAAPVLQNPGNTQVDIVMRRVAQGGTATPPPSGGNTVTPGALVPQALRQNWRVTQIGGQAVTSASAPTAPSLRFDAQEPRVSGNSSCNGFSGSYGLQGDRIQFGPAAATKRACARSVETEFFSALNAVRSLRHSGAKLQLLDAGGRAVLTLTRD